MTFDQPLASAKAPWTRTTVGLGSEALAEARPVSERAAPARRDLERRAFMILIFGSRWRAALRFLRSIESNCIAYNVSVDDILLSIDLHTLHQWLTLENTSP